MNKMSDGQDATLGNYRKNAVAVFGANSKAVKFLDGKIAAHGEDEEVLADEGQFLGVLAHLHQEGETEENWKKHGITVETPFFGRDGGIIFRQEPFPPTETLHAQPKFMSSLIDGLNKAYQQGWAEALAHFGRPDEHPFEDAGPLHRNVLLQTLEERGITFRDYVLSPTGIKACNLKTAIVLAALFDKPKHMKIVKWLRDGNGESLEDLCETTEQLLTVAGRRLDKASAEEIMGDVVFECEDGKTYVGSVEFVFGEANPAWLKEFVDE